MSRRSRLLLALVALLAVAGGVWLYSRLDHAAATGTLTLYGNVDIREVQPAFNGTGHVKQVLVQEGSVIKKGELLATLDGTRYAASLAAAQAEMRSVDEALKKLLAGTRPEEIAQAAATMAALRVTFENDAATYRRYEFLAKTNAATIAERDNAKAAFDAAQQRFEAAQQLYLLAVKGPREEDIAAARASLEAAQARVTLAAREFHDTKLYAPSGGVVEDRILEPGDMASPSTPVFTIALPSPLWVRAYVPESDLGRITLGMAATVTTDSFPGHVYHGWVGYISPVAEFTPKTVETPELRTALVYQMRVYVCDARGELRLGMPATVHVDLARAPGAAPPPGCGPDHAARN
jgi:membrane fusion protein YbhG